MYIYKSIVVRIVDGDTIDLDIDLGFYCWLKKQRVRLKEIDTPEIRTRDLEEKKYGKLATKFVENFCPVGTTVYLKSTLGDTGKFGRLLGDIYKLDDHTHSNSLNDALLKARHAVHYTGQNRDEIKELHLENRRWIKLHETV